ncbi:MAG: class I mannose-6-phosphate isomerase [Acutalibacter sp.]|nr:class I mannose-6-phosphate isomerase [Acutalibacter sp.]
MNYNKSPVNKISADSIQAWKGYDTILTQLQKSVDSILAGSKCVLAVETYPGVDDEELLGALRELSPALIIDMQDALCTKEEYWAKIHPFLTDDRVFGKMYFGELRDFQVPEKRQALREKIDRVQGLVLVYGFGAAELCEADILVYADLARWEIQQRYRAGMGNYHTDNGDEDTLKKFKQGYFFEWRIADKLKRRLYDRMDYYLDTNRKNDPAMLTGQIFREGLRQIVAGPFRTVPYFDPGVWGGQWMKKVCGLDPDKPNFAWSFDGVPEENSIYLEVDGVLVESPAVNLVYYCPKELLGEKVYARFGAEFPIRFDFLDTMGGQNLSLQVHPLTDYIHNQFGMSYTQDESYYILDAEEGASVYLGIKDGAKPEEMVADLRSAQTGEIAFDAEKYVNKIPAKKHDHFLIPAGTVHCSGSGCMVLEISATPYIFTFKLWDWGRVGLDGKPRPIHIDHGEKNIQWDRRTEWVQKHLVSPTCTVTETPDYTEEHTGLHALEFIETRRYEIRTACELDTDGTVNMLNLVEGEAAVIESPTGAFEPFEVHYAETFILPASAGAYRIRPAGAKPIKVIRAFVRNTGR